MHAVLKLLTLSARAGAYRSGFQGVLLGRLGALASAGVQNADIAAVGEGVLSGVVHVVDLGEQVHVALKACLQSSTALALLVVLQSPCAVQQSLGQIILTDLVRHGPIQPILVNLRP